MEGGRSVEDVEAHAEPEDARDEDVERRRADLHGAAPPRCAPEEGVERADAGLHVLEPRVEQHGRAEPVRRRREGAPVFAEIVTPIASVAETVPLWKEGSAAPRANRTAVVEPQVDDVDAEYARLAGSVELVHEPKTMPWGNRTFQLRDPEGTAVSLYTPVTDEAKKRFAGR